MPSKMEAPESAKTITVYVNGEQENGEIIWNKNKVFFALFRKLFPIKSKYTQKSFIYSFLPIATEFTYEKLGIKYLQTLLIVKFEKLLVG